MITYYKNVFLLLTTVAVNVGCHYLLEEYAPSYGNYEPTKYANSGDNMHQLQRRNSDYISGRYDLSKSKENSQLEEIIIDDTHGTSLYNRVRRGGVYGEKIEKTERVVPEVDNIDTKYSRTRNTSRSTSNLKINPRNEKIRNSPDNAKLEEAQTQNFTSRNLSNRRRNDQSSRINQKRIVKKENFAEYHYEQPTQFKDVEYIQNFNPNPLPNFQNEDQKFLHQLSSIQPQHFMNTKQQYFQTFSSSTPSPYQQLHYNTNGQREKLLINVPDEPAHDNTQTNQKQIEQVFTYIHNQPHIKSQFENIQRYISQDVSPKRVLVQKYQSPDYIQVPNQQKVEVYSSTSSQPETKPHVERVQYNTPVNQVNYQTQNIRYTAPIYQPEYGSKHNSNEENSGATTIDGEVKYTNYGYRHQPPQPTNPSYNQYNYGANKYEQQYPANVNSNYGTDNNYPHVTEAQIKPDDKLSSQNHYPAILVHIDGKIGIPFYPTSKNIYNVPQDVKFDYEGIPLVNLNEKQEDKQNNENSYEQSNSNNEDFRKEVYKNHYGYEENEEPNAQRRLYTGLTFHASSRNLYDGKTPSLRNPPPRHGDVIWQAGDPITDPQEFLVRQLNETCAYIQFNETTPGNEDGTTLNIWQAGDYSAQREEEELIRSVNITCENYTTDALSNFTSGYTIIDYCSQCVDKYSDDDTYGYTNDYVNQNQDNVYGYPPEQNYNILYQPSQGNYEYYNDGNNYDSRLENGEIAGFYKRKRLALDNAKNMTK